MSIGKETIVCAWRCSRNAESTIDGRILTSQSTYSASFWGYLVGLLPVNAPGSGSEIMTIERLPQAICTPYRMPSPRNNHVPGRWQSNFSGKRRWPATALGYGYQVSTVRFISFLSADF